MTASGTRQRTVEYAFGRNADTASGITGVTENSGGFGPVHVVGDTIMTYDGSTLVSRVGDDYRNFDDFGNFAEHFLVVDRFGEQNIESHTEEIDHDYDTQKWLIRMPTTHDETSYNSDPDGLSKRHYVYNYDALGEVHEYVNDSEDDAVSTVFTRNKYSTVDRIDLIGSNGGTRTTKIDQFDDQHTFPKQITVGVGAPVPHKFTYSYDLRFGRPTQIIDSNHQAETWSYDSFGRLLSHAEPSGKGESYVYDFDAADAKGVIPVKPVYKTTTTFQGGGSHVQELDAFGRQVREQDLGLDATVVDETEYDLSGELSRQARPHASGDKTQGVVTYTYNDAGDVTQIATPDGAVTSYDRADVVSSASSYLFLLGQPTATNVLQITKPAVDGRSAVEYRETDTLGRLVASIDSLGSTVDYKYDAYGNSLETRQAGIDHKAIVKSWQYDPQGRLQSTDDPDHGHHDYTYTEFGQVFTHQGPDALDETFEYDEFGRLKHATNNDGSRHWTYDEGVNAIGELSSETVDTGGISPTGNGVTYGYDANERLSSLTYKIGDSSSQLSFDYTRAGQLQFITYPSIGATQFKVERVYDPPSGALAAVQEAGGGRTFWKLNSTFQGYLPRVETIGPVQRTTTYFDATGLVQTLKAKTSSGNTPVQSDSYTYNARRELETREDLLRPNSKETFGYDVLSRLRTITPVVGDPAAIEIDSIGNITSKSGIGAYGYQDPNGNPHAVTSAGERVFEYDARGNQWHRTVPLGVQEIDYNAVGLPYQIQTTGSAGTQVESLEYDADGMRLAKQVLGRDGVPDLSHFYAGSLYERFVRRDGGVSDTPCADIGGTACNLYRVFGGSGEVAEVIRAENTGILAGERTQFLFDDRLGSPEVITSETGAIQSRQHFSPFGETTNDTGANELTTTGFTGHESDAEVGLINMVGRVYDPEVGRFLTPDPETPNADWLQGYNPYSYVQNNPLNATDPTGFVPFQPDNIATYHDADKQRLASGKNGINRGKPGTKPGVVKPARDGGKANGKGDPGQPGASADPHKGSQGGQHPNTHNGEPGSGHGPPAGDSNHPGQPGNTLAQQLLTFVAFATLATPNDIRTDGTGSAGGVPGGGCGGGRTCYGGGYVQAGWAAVNLFGAEIVDGLGAALKGLGGVFKRGAGELGGLFRAAENDAREICGGGSCFCFAAGTPVLTETGSVPIEAVQLGSRVEPATKECEALDISDWYEIDLQLAGSKEADSFKMRLLRPRTWLDDSANSLGSVAVDWPELNIQGRAIVTAVHPATGLTSGPGCPITATIEHLGDDVMSIDIAGSDQPLLVTAGHRLFSASRNDWVTATSLMPGELLKTETGTAEIVALDRQARASVPVYNLEVALNHQYYVNDVHVLAHNACGEGTRGAKAIAPGEHAGESIAARGPERDFTRAERDAVNGIGERTGCHTCGTPDPGTKSGDFVLDHQPPNKFNQSGGPQRLFPQCLGCSHVQGGEIRALSE